MGFKKVVGLEDAAGSSQTLSVRLPTDLFEALQAAEKRLEARGKRVNRSALFQDAVERFLEGISGVFEESSDTEVAQAGKRARKSESNPPAEAPA